MLMIVLFAHQPGFAQERQSNQTVLAGKIEKYHRTELYFGRSKPDGKTITDDEWSEFLAEVVTPRFPDGFTVFDGVGQYREKSGQIVKEQTKIVFFLYSRKERKISSTEIDEIRAAYVKRFNQESVLRIDLQRSVRVAF